MSVTFAIEALFTGTYRADCDEAGELARGQLEDVQVAIDEHPWQTCPGCLGYRPGPWSVTDIDGAPEVDLANANARDLLLALDLPFQEDELAGELPGEEFLGRVLLALAADRDESAVPDLVDGGWVFCGRREGYVSEVLHRLHAVAAEAVRLGRSVIWA
jgi:hypothetical protein